MNRPTFFRKLVLLILVSLALSFSASPGASRGAASPRAPMDVSITYGDPQLVDLYVSVGYFDPSQLWYGLYRQEGASNVLLRALSPYENFYLRDANLARNKTYRYWTCSIVLSDPGSSCTARKDIESPTDAYWTTNGFTNGAPRSDVTWGGGEYQVNAVTLNPGVTVTITPGTTVKGNTSSQNKEFDLQGGNLVARGVSFQGHSTATDRWIFTGSNMADTSLVIIEDSTFTNLYGVSLYLYGGVQFTGNTLSAGEVTLRAELAAGNVVIRGNQMPAAEVFVCSDAGQMTALSVENNLLYYLTVGPCNNATPTTAPIRVANNEFAAPGGSGYYLGEITIQADSPSILVENNRSADAVEISLHSEVAAGGSAFTRIVRGHASAALLVDMPDVLVENNRFYPVHHAGIQLASSRALVRNNTVRPYASAGGYCFDGIDLREDSMYQQPVANNTIIDNNVINCSGLNLGEYASDNVIHDNIFRATSYAALNTGSRGVNNLIYNNQFHGYFGYTSFGNPGTSQWDTTPAPGENIVGGPNLGGNYWKLYNGDDNNGDGLGETPYVLNQGAGEQDDHPLIAANLPDLIISPIALDPNQATYNGSQYILPVWVEISNMGIEPASNVSVRFSDPSGWSETRVLTATLAPGDSQILAVQWNITPLLLTGNGKATLQFTAAADPTDAIAEWKNSNNNATASAPLDVRPVVLSLAPGYTLQNTFFIANQSLPNKIVVGVDWNGALPGAGAAPFGEVYFELNGVATTVAGTQSGGEHTYDMGSDFTASFACQNNRLRIWAALPVTGGEFRTLETTWQPTVVPYPEWVLWAIANLPGSDAQFDTINKAPFVEYKYDFVYPDPAFETTFTAPGWLPYFGGEEFGILETQGQLHAFGQSSGTGSASAEGGTGLALAALSATGRVYGSGEAKFTCADGLDLTRAEVGLEITVSVEKEAGIADLVPGLRSAEEVPIIGRVIRWINNVAKVKGSLSPRVHILTRFADDESGALAFEQSLGTGALKAAAEISLSPLDDVTVEAHGGGEPYITLQVPANPGYLYELGINLFYGASYQAWSWEGEYEETFTCKFPGACAEPPEKATTGWGVIGHDWRLLADKNVPASAQSDEALLLAGIYPRPQPALALDSGSQAVLAFVADDPADPAGKGTEIALLTYDGAGWDTAPITITADAQPDYAPVVIYGGNGEWPVLWEHSKIGGALPSEPTLEFAQSLEIFACDWNGATCGSPTALTDDSLMDYAPQLWPAGANTALALWQTNDGTDILGVAAHPITLTYAVWTNAAGWGAPAPAAAGLQDVLKVAFAANSASQAALVFARDMDGNLNTTNDSELFYSTFDGANWTAPLRMTDDALPDVQPALAYDAAGNLHLAWLRNGNLVWLKDSWDEAQALVVHADPQDGGLLGAQLARAADGNLALAWQTLGESGRNLGYTVYDSAAAAWGLEQSLLDDLAPGSSAVEADHSLAFSGDGRLFAAYRRIAVETEDIPGVGQVSIFGQSDLAALVHTVGRDLTFERFSIEPASPAPGQPITLTAVLKNVGDLQIANPEYGFYLNYQPVAAPQSAPALAGGQAVTVTLASTAPAGVGPFAFSARADPDGSVIETDEENNTITFTLSLPDLSVDWLASTAGDGLAVTARLRNQGAGRIDGPLQFEVRADDPLTGTLLASQWLTLTLQPGQTVEVSFAFTDTALLGGVATLWFIADSTAALPEADETNNAAWTWPGILPDIQVTVTDAGEGFVTVRLANPGLVDAAGVLVEARLDGITGTLVSAQAIPLLAAGEEKTLTFHVYTPGEHLLFVRADPLQAIPERDEANNLAIQTVIGSSTRKIYLPLVVK